MRLLLVFVLRPLLLALRLPFQVSNFKLQTLLLLFLILILISPFSILNSAAAPSLPPLVPEGETLKDLNVPDWDTLLSSISHKSDVFSVTFSPDGKTLAYSSFDDTVHLWDVATGRETRRFEGHSGRVFSVVFSHDGKRLISGSADDTIRIWDISSGKQQALMMGGQRGTWFGCVADQGCLRGDDGTLLTRRDKSDQLRPVLPPHPNANPNASDLDVAPLRVAYVGDMPLQVLDGKAAPITLTAHNTGEGRIYWLNAVQTETSDNE